MIKLLDDLINERTPSLQHGLVHDITWSYWGEGVLCLTPNNSNGYAKSVILSAGVHGNETAPIELLDKLIFAIMAGQITLGVQLLVIFGNPYAIRANVRYIDDDINRLFVGKHQTYHHLEAKRVQQLEYWVGDFINQAKARHKTCYHYDLHTAIRPSLLPVFALLPYTAQAADPNLINSLNAAAMQAIVYHSHPSTTFSQFSANCGAKSVTLELGKVAAFGQNNLNDFAQSYAMLQRLIRGDDFADVPAVATHFVIDEIIIKQSDAFRLLVDADLPNFSQLAAHQPIAYDEINQGGFITPITYQYDQPRYTLFLNQNVKVGLRAGMLMYATTNPDSNQ